MKAITCLLPLAALTAGAASAAPQANLVVNGGFETGDTSSWLDLGTPNSTFNVTSDSNSGSFGAEIFNPDQTSAAVIKQVNLGAGLLAPGVAFAELFSEIAGGGVSSSEILTGAPLNLTGSWQSFSFTAAAGPDVSGGLTLQFAVVNGANSGSLAQFFLDDVAITPPGLGANYCTANANSLGLAASMSAQGSSVALDNNLTLAAADLVPSSFGFFLTSRSTGLSANPGGSQGNLCLGGSIGRYVGAGQIQQADSAGTITLFLDLTMIPQPAGFVAATSGDTWSFQAWYRDSIGGQATSNFTDGLTINFQ